MFVNVKMVYGFNPVCTDVRCIFREAMIPCILLALGGNLVDGMYFISSLLLL